MARLVPNSNKNRLAEQKDSRSGYRNVQARRSLQPWGLYDGGRNPDYGCRCVGNLLNGAHQFFCQGDGLECNPVRRPDRLCHVFKSSMMDFNVWQPQANHQMAQECSSPRPRFNQMTLFKLRYDLEWNCRRSITRPYVEQSSLRIELQSDPRRLDDKAPDQRRAGQPRQIDFLIPTRQFITVGSKRCLLLRLQIELKSTKLGFENLEVGHTATGVRAGAASGAFPDGRAESRSKRA